MKKSALLELGRALEIEAEKLRKREDLIPAGGKIGEAAVYFLKAICRIEQISCASEPDYFKATAELARRLRSQQINRQFGLAILLYLNAQHAADPDKSPAMVNLSGDQIKTYFKDVQKLIHLIANYLRMIRK